VFLDTSDPRTEGHFRIHSNGNRRSAYGLIDSHYVYLTDDATGSMRGHRLSRRKEPKEGRRAGKWKIAGANSDRTHRGAGDGRSDIFTMFSKRRGAYLAYWRDGLVILDVGSGIKGGSPEKPQLVSQFRMNYHELYGDGWLAGAHAGLSL